MQPNPNARQERTARAILAFQSGGDREGAFSELFELHYQPVRRFFARKGFPPQDCLDLTQETFIGIYRGLEAYRSEARFETWLFKIATTTYLKKLRSAVTVKRSGTEISEEDIKGGEPALESPERQLSDVLSDERRQALQQAVQSLPDQMRRCLMLRIYQEMKYREIATVMRLSIDTVKAHLFQARKRLQEQLRGDYGATLDF